MFTTDFNYKRHIARANGIFKINKPIKFKFLPISINNNKENLIYYSPVIAGNAYDRTMLGLALYNNSINDKKVEWLINPLYGFGSKKMVGSGKIQTNINTIVYFQELILDIKSEVFITNMMICTRERWIKQELFTEFRLKSKDQEDSISKY